MACPISLRVWGFCRMAEAVGPIDVTRWLGLVLFFWRLGCVVSGSWVFLCRGLASHTDVRFLHHAVLGLSACAAQLRR